MFYLIAKYLQAWLDETEFGFLRVFTFPTFQSAAAVLVSFLVVILAGPSTIRWLRKQKIGDLANFDQEAFNQTMLSKKGTPTMGGVLIITAILIATLLLADLQNFYVQMALICLVWLGAVGAVDDWLKLTVARREGKRDGLGRGEKLLFQFGLAIILCFFTWNHGHELTPTQSFYVPFLKQPLFGLSMLGFIAIGTFVLVFTTNAVNLTDGLDGLASGCTVIAAIVFLLLAIIIGDLQLSSALLYPHVNAAGQMAVLAGAIVGACLGFLWFNCNPASIFMGDTGSLALGGLLGYIAIVLRQEVLLLIVGGIFYVEALSSLMQTYYFKYTRIRYGEGRRIFLMAPLHHHFQKKGWSETQVVTRFWLIAAMLAAVGVATVKLR
jgi:phospho-N-acetylmuramoyl-pentapeptide-transferase